MCIISAAAAAMEEKCTTRIFFRLAFAERQAGAFSLHVSASAHFPSVHFLQKMECVRHCRSLNESRMATFESFLDLIHARIFLCVNATLYMYTLYIHIFRKIHINVFIMCLALAASSFSFGLNGENCGREKPG